MRTAAGELFDIDTALRPNGNSGLLVTSMGAFERYQHGRGSNTAWTWEHQALTRARFCAGDKRLGERFERLRAEVLARPKGLQAFRILSMDESTAVHPSTLPPARTHVTVTPTSGLERALVKWFNRLRGFGFLTRGEGTPDIFVHMETLRRYGLAELRPGQTVLVRFGPGPKGLMAAEVHPDSGPHGPASH